MRNKLIALLIFIFCFSSLTVNVKGTTYFKEGNVVKVYNEEFGKFDIGCSFNETCKNIVAAGKMNSDDLKALYLCSAKCEMLDISEVQVTDETELPIWCFVDVYNLREVKLPQKLKNISDCTFCNCSCLESVQLPCGLRKVGKGSFQNCPRLKLEIPSEVKCAEDRFIGSPGVKHLELKLPYKSYSVFSSILSWVGL